MLRMQLEGIDTKLRFDEVGTVLQVSDGVVRIYGLQNAEANELLEFENGIRAVVMNLEEDNVGAVLLGPTDRIKEGDTVKRTRRHRVDQRQRGNARPCDRPAGRAPRRARPDRRGDHRDAFGA